MFALFSLYRKPRGKYLHFSIDLLLLSTHNSEKQTKTGGLCPICGVSLCFSVKKLWLSVSLLLSVWYDGIKETRYLQDSEITVYGTESIINISGGKKDEPI